MFADFLILSLATWRLASLFVNEDGPGEMFDHFRYWAGIRPDEYSELKPTNWFAESLTCLWCFSVWTGSFLTLVYLLLPTIVWKLIAFPLALSAFAIFLQRIMETSGITGSLEETD